jgi:alpha-D-ribose 1-methylphosphonate 5-triphosphate diphosphatase
VVDAVASDHVPPALLEAAWTASRDQGFALPAAVTMITDRPARVASFTDRGRLAPGLRADAARISAFGGTPVFRHVWRGGEGGI